MGGGAVSFLKRGGYPDTSIVFLWHGGGEGMFCRGELSGYHENYISQGWGVEFKVWDGYFEEKKC